MISLSLLAELHAEGHLVTLRRDRFDEWDRGYIAAYSPDLIVMSIVDLNCSFNGSMIIETSQVTLAKWGTKLLTAWARALSESPSSPDAAKYADLTSWESAVRSVAAHEPVLAFHCEAYGSSAFHVGTKVKVDAESVQAEDVTVDGRISGHFAIDLDDLTKVEFGGGYELALWRMVQLNREV